VDFSLAKDGTIKHFKKHDKEAFLVCVMNKSDAGQAHSLFQPKQKGRNPKISFDGFFECAEILLSIMEVNDVVVKDDDDNDDDDESASPAVEESFMTRFTRHGRALYRNAQEIIVVGNVDGTRSNTTFLDHFHSHGEVLMSDKSVKKVADECKAANSKPCKKLFQLYFDNWVKFHCTIASDTICWQAVAVLYKVNVVVYFVGGRVPVKCEVQEPRCTIEMIVNVNYKFLGIVSNDLILKGFNKNNNKN